EPARPLLVVVSLSALSGRQGLDRLGHIAGQVAVVEREHKKLVRIRHHGPCTRCGWWAACGHQRIRDRSEEVVIVRNIEGVLLNGLAIDNHRYVLSERHTLDLRRYETSIESGGFQHSDNIQK